MRVVCTSAKSGRKGARKCLHPMFFSGTNCFGRGFGQKLMQARHFMDERVLIWVKDRCVPKVYCELYFRPLVTFQKRLRSSIAVMKRIGRSCPDILFLKHSCSTLIRQSSNPLCGFSMMEQVRLCAVWSTENWRGSSLNHIQGWMTVWICYWHAPQNRSLLTTSHVWFPLLRMN